MLPGLAGKPTPRSHQTLRARPWRGLILGRYGSGRGGIASGAMRSRRGVSSSTIHACKSASQRISNPLDDRHNPNARNRLAVSIPDPAAQGKREAQKIPPRPCRNRCRVAGTGRGNPDSDSRIGQGQAVGGFRHLLNGFPLLRANDTRASRGGRATAGGRGPEPFLAPDL